MAPSESHALPGTGHGVQTALDALDANVPGEHAMGSVVPTPQAAPGGHGRQPEPADNAQE